MKHNFRSYYSLARKRILFVTLLWAIVFSGCSGLRYLDEGQKLYTGSKIVIESDGRVDNKGEIITELERVIRPRPNQKLFFGRPRLWFYNIAGEDPRTRPGRWMKNRIGRPPVLWEEFDGQRSQRLMENRLFNMGFFDSQILFTPLEGSKKAKARFDVRLPAPYTIREIFHLEEETEIAGAINNSMERSLIKKGQTYRLSKLKEERDRITRMLRDQGYFYFRSDLILFRADTTAGNREVDLFLTLRDNIPANAIKKYRIRNITINADNTLALSDSLGHEEGQHKGQTINILNNNQFKPSLLNRTVFLEQGELYNTRDHDLTINHLMGLGVFKFVNIRFADARVDGDPQLDMSVLLTPMDKKNLGIELRGVSKSNDFAGPGLSLSYLNRNLLGGAENFSINLDGSWELLLQRRERRASSIEAGLTSELIIPRFIVPFGLIDYSPMFIPKTRISAGFNYLSRTDAFSVSSIRSLFGYQWNHSIATQHRFNPFVFSIFSLGTISPEYEQFFSDEVLLRRGLFEQFLLGSEYSFYFNSQLRKARKHGWYVNFNTDLSGNMLYLLLKELNLGKPLTDGGYGILNQSFSQYAKTDFDIRYYLDLGGGKRLVSRFAAGIGVPYGNSSTLPYVKLFTSGGSNSIRAFQPRSLGPGSYQSPDTLASSFDIYQSGELKMEMNIEYRFDISNVIKGAVFADAGNVWNLQEIEKAPGGQFKRSEFASQIALGAGTGLRFDFTFFILRFDLAMPLAVPYDDSQGYFQRFRFTEGEWRRNNILLNLAIGYPF